MKTFKELQAESLKDACWKGYEAIGTKKKNGKEVPNCVPVKEETGDYVVDIHHVHPDGKKEVFKYKVGAAKSARHAKNIAMQKHEKKNIPFKNFGANSSDVHPVNEGLEAEQIDEISKDTLGSYVHKSFAAGNELHKQIDKETDPAKKADLKAKLDKRNTGVIKAAKRLTKEEKINVADEKDLPFEPDAPKKNPSAKAGKYGVGYSTAKHLARMALKKVQDKKQAKEEVADEGYVSDAQRKAVWASKNEKNEAVGDDVISAKQKMAKTGKMSIKDKLLSIPRGFKAAKAGKSEVDANLKEEIHVVGNKSYYGDKSTPVKLSSHKTQAEADAALAKHKAAGTDRTRWHKTVDDAGLAKHMKEEVQLDEVTSPMQKLRDAHDRHMEKALAANKAGDDEATKVHQQYMQKIKAKMNKLKQNEEIDLVEMENLCEISKSTLASYAKKATDDAALRARFDNRDQPSVSKKTVKRLLGAKKAIDKLAKEEVELDEAVDVAAVRAEYKKNESDNRHTENAALLAKHFGSKSDQNKVAKAKAYRDRNNGYSSDAEGRHYSKMAHEVHSKLYHHIKEEVESIEELNKSTLASYANKSHDQLMKHTASVNMKYGRGDKDATAYALDKDALRKTANRTQGMKTAIKKLAKEETEEQKKEKDALDLKLKQWRAQQRVEKALKKEETMVSYKDFMSALNEELKGKQHKLDKNKNGKLDAHDFKLLRKEEQEIEEAKIDDLKDKMAAKKATMSAYDKDYKPAAKSNVQKVKGHSYGAGEEEGEDEDDNNKKVSKPAKPEVKRGRGRPAGSKSGARN